MRLSQSSPSLDGTVPDSAGAHDMSVDKGQTMDHTHFDRWTQALPTRLPRRRASVLAVIALASIGMSSPTEAKKKKRKKKKRQAPASPPPPPGPPPADIPRACLKAFDRCASSDTCCAHPDSATAMVCRDANPNLDDPLSRCCLPSGARTTRWPGAAACCSHGWRWDQPENWDGPGTCCVANAMPLLAGDTPSACCDSANTTIDGRCCIPSGQPCDSFFQELCCNGSTCPGNTNICP